jgi:hypothetical protein
MASCVSSQYPACRTLYGIGTKHTIFIETVESRFLTFSFHHKRSLLRLVNVLLHAVVAQLIGVIARRLFVLTNNNARSLSSWFASLTAIATQWLCILLFAWHPTHVEVVANAANRPHLLALLASCIVILLGSNGKRDASVIASSTDSRLVHFVKCLGSGIVLVLGLLCSETMVFQLPAMLVTTTLIQWRRFKLHKRNHDSHSQNYSWWVFVQNMAPLWLWWTSLVLVYLLLRYWANTLSMSDGLLDRAEVPFHDLHGWTRLYSFAYVIAIHVGKAVGLDWIGFAHEYSYNCIPPITSIQDARMRIPIGILVGIILATVVLYMRSRTRPQSTAIQHPDTTESGKETKKDDDDDALCFWLMALSWFIALLPISGLVKVGTFVADRIVVPATVGVSIGLARLFILLWTKPRPLPLRVALLVMTCWWWWGLGSARILERTKEWTRYDLLLLRTQETCPSSAKNLLQLSKLYSATSGTYHPTVQQNLDIAL